MNRIEESRNSLLRVETAIDAIINVADIVPEEHSREYMDRLNRAAFDLGELVDRLEENA